MLDHIIPDDSTKASEPRDFKCQQLDDIVHTWIYGTLCIILLQSIVQPKDRARDAWNRIEEIFHNNKTTHVLHLESQFNELSLAQFPNVKSYCNELNSIATNVNNVGTSVSDYPLTLNVIHGLTLDYRTFPFLAQQMNLVPSFETLHSMLEF